ncbi:MAG TPA: hypothetical protein PLU30_20385 [Verrucomicrobiae bacterium]|nr:hypothetical protein [Verrucomicrobiae bacterium]
MQSHVRFTPAYIALALALCECAAPRLEPDGVRGDPTLPPSPVFFVREFEEGNDWLSADGQPAQRPEILAHLNSLTAKMRDRFSKLGPTRVLMTSIPKEGILVTGQLTRVRDGQNPTVGGRILIFDLARSYHYPVTIFDIHPSPQVHPRDLNDVWDLIARTSQNFVRERMR